MPKPRDYAYEALAEVTDADMSANRGELNVALKAIREQAQIEDGYALGAEIHTRAKAYRLVMGDALLTPTALAKHWRRVEAVSERKPASVNQHASVSSCKTCSGDRFVLVGTRPSQQTPWMKAHGIVVKGDAENETYAPCPSCHPIEVEFRRYDGSMFRSVDPAAARGMMLG